MKPETSPKALDHPVWAVWNRLIRIFPVWAVIPAAFVTPGAWTMSGLDFVSGLRRNQSTDKAFKLTQELTSARFAALCDLAALGTRLIQLHQF